MDLLDANFLTLMWFFARAIPAFALACIMWIIPVFILIMIVAIAESNAK